MNILITGSEGYIGSVLRPILTKRGHSVMGVDTGFFRNESLDQSDQDVIFEDIRNISEQQLAGFDAVIHLADLSNDPVGMIDETVTREINFYGALSVAKKAKAVGVKRYVYSSSCSVYGNHIDSEATEMSPTLPQTMYAQCKKDVEQELLNLSGMGFTPVILRNSTVYGMSPSMRFDLVINKMAADAYLFRNIIVNNGGNQWRPLVHINDVCHAFVCAVEAPDTAVSNEIFNVGSREGNCQMADLAKLIHEEFTESTLILGHIALMDKRSYKVNFDKIHAKLPGYFTQYTIRNGVRELHEQFRSLGLTEDYYNHPTRTRLKQIMHLLQSQMIDSRYYWKRINHAKPI